MEPESPETAALEERLRAALAARSALVTTQSLRPVKTSPARRWPRTALGLGAAVGAALLVVVTVVTLPNPPAEQERDGSVAASRRVDLHDLSFQVPRGWTAWQPETGDQACVQPRGVPHEMDPCWAMGVQVVTGAGEQNGSLDDEDWPRTWLNCWTADGRTNASDPMTGSRLIARDSVRISGQRVAYRAWRVTCRSGEEFTSRLWWIPRHDISIRALHLDSRGATLAEELVSSIALR
ncbi:hypothetical protein [Streptomyces sp. NPDC051776]|uniref:hypothetical protein n=1 Tax=Streptomyces sp. NPDC051776 TaxID=3155414 RepID=UPI00341DD137